MKNKKFFQILFCTVMSAALLTGCGKSKDIVLYGSEEQFGKAQLCDYSNLSVTKNVYEISDAMVDEQIDSMLSENMDYKEVDRAIAEDDIAVLSMTISSGGETLYDFTENGDGSYELSVGYEEFGEEFDKKIIGSKKGDHLTFSVNYDADSDLEEFAGKTIDYDINVDSVTVEDTPKLDENFIKNKLGYDSEEAMRKAVRDDLVSQYEQNSETEVYTEMIDQIIEDSTFEEYSTETLSSYRSSVEENYAVYMEMLGAETIQDVFDMFNMTTEDIENEALSFAKRDTVINQIGREQDIRVSQKDYDQLVSDLATQYEYESSAEMIQDYGEDSIKSFLLEEKVCEYLLAHANVTENKVAAEAMYDDMDGEGMDGEDFDDAEEGELIDVPLLGDEEEFDEDDSDDSDDEYLGDEDAEEDTDEALEEEDTDDDTDEDSGEEDDSEDSEDDSEDPEIEEEEDPAVETE